MVLDTKYNHSYRVLEISPIYLIKIICIYQTKRWYVRF